MHFRLTTALAALAIMCACVGAQAGSLTAPAGYTSVDTALGMPAGGWFGGFDILPNGNFVVHDGLSIREITPGGVNVGSLYTYSGTVYGSFVKYNAANDRVYFGESSYGAIMSVAASGGTATVITDLDNNFDIDFHNGQLYAGAGASVYRVNENTGSCDEIATIGDTSGPMIFDPAGNLIYGLGDRTWNTPRDQTIVRWSAAEVANAGGGVVLGESDADTLATGVAAYAFAWASSGDLLFSESVYPSAIKSLTDMSTYSGPVSAFDSITNIRVNAANGQITAAVSYYDELWNQYTVLSTIVPAATPVPEPTSLLALCSMLGAAGALRIRRRR